jgi:predicted DsbA family dithiol-disulfide isomerase
LENLQIVKKDSFFVSENLTIKAPLTLPNPRQAQEALCFAQTFDKVLELALVFYKSFFESNIDIGEKNVLLQLVNQVGIDSVELEKHLDTRTYTGKVAKDEQKFEIFNFLGVPAMFIGEKNFAPGTFSPLNGFHNFEYLDDMVSHILKNTLQRNL